MDNDILGRELYINDIFNYIDTKKNSVLCLNGEWGCGKTFIINKLISEMEVKNRNLEKQYLPILINSWEYDYYDEPLEGLVLALYDYAFPKIEKNMSDRLSSMICAGLGILKLMIMEVINNKTGIDLSKLKLDKKMKRYISNFGENVFEKEELDSMSSLKQTLFVIKSVLNKISNDMNIIIIIDDLDRCLPEHAIKTLERLHHIMSATENITMILALDKKQLSKTINNFFGDCDINKYLNKFIDNYINIDYGDLNFKFEENYADYFNEFTHNTSCVSELNYILLNMLDKNIRNWKKTIADAYTIHKISINNNLEEIKYDNSLLIAELLYITICNDFNALQMVIYGWSNSFSFSVPFFDKLWNQINASFTNWTYYEDSKYFILKDICWHKVIELLVAAKNVIFVDGNKEIEPKYVINENKLIKEKILFGSFVEHVSVLK